MEDILFAHQERYPRMEAADYYKLVYQHTFGMEHYQVDKAVSLKKLVTEFDGLRALHDQALSEPIGNGYVRVHLTAKGMNKELLPVLNSLFIRPTNKRAGTRGEFEDKLNRIVELAREGKLLLPAEDIEDAFAMYRVKDYPAVSHSKTFHDYYDPHYRVLDAGSLKYLPVLEHLLALENMEHPPLVAIDGRCGSGKTTFAEIIAETVDCNVFHMDDFFLPKELKTPERLSEPGGNVDYERVLEEIIQPLERKEDVKLIPFNCTINDLDQITIVPFKKINVIEGVYALHPELEKYYDYKIFMTVDSETQIMRIKERGQGAKIDRFINEWIPLEEKYFREADIEQKADVTIRTSNTCK